MKGLITKAHDFATEAHKGQVRKYTGEPYISHPVTVANMVEEHYRHYLPDEDPETAICAALLHDVVEDCDVTSEQIHAEFGFAIAEAVWYLTKPPAFLGKAAVTAIYAHQLAHACPTAKIVKFFDIKHNYEFLDEIDPKFWATQRPKLEERLDAMNVSEIRGLIEGNTNVYTKIKGE